MVQDNMVGSTGTAIGSAEFFVKDQEQSGAGCFVNKICITLICIAPVDVEF